MAKLFSGYAQSRGFQNKPSANRARQIASGSEYVRSLERMRQVERNNAVQTHQLLQQAFDIDQQNRQNFRDIEVKAANVERQAKQDLFDNQIKRLEIEAQQQTDIFTALSGISSTAADIIKTEADKRKQAEIQFGQNLVIQYGLNSQEVAELQAMEGGLKEYHNQQSPLIHRLRQQGASEKDINALMQSSGWNAYGSALAAVQRAGKDYDLYLTEKYNQDVTINGVNMSLASAEADGDVAAIAGIFDRHRMNFLQEYLPGYDAAFVAKHAREGMQQAESRRKRSLSTRIEEQNRAGNEAKEKENIALALNADHTDPSAFIDHYTSEAGGIDSDILSQVHIRKHGLLKELVEDGAVDSRVAEKILQAPVFAKHFNREVAYATAFPAMATELREAIQKQDEERTRLKNIARQAQIDQGKQLTFALEQQFLEDPSQISQESIAQAQMAIAKTGYTEGHNRMARMLQFSTEKTNDREFDQKYAAQKALGVFPSNREILYSGLSPQKMTAELQARKEFEDTGLTDEVVSALDKSINSALRKKLGDNGLLDKVLPESFELAKFDAKQQALLDFRTSYKGPGSTSESLNYAIGQLNKELQNPEGKFKINVQTTDSQGRSKFTPGFTNYMGLSSKKESTLPYIYDQHSNGTEAFRGELFLESGRVKSLVNNLNRGNVSALPSEFFAISKSLKGKVPMSEILLEQIGQARKVDPTIEELSPEVKSIFQKVEKTVPPDILSTIQRYSTPATINRSLVSADIPAIYDQSDPYVSFGRMLEAVEIEDSYIPIFLAIMKGESSGQPAIDTVKSGLDPGKKNEYSIGLLQVNTQAHMDKLRKLGYSIDDLRNPVKNLQVAMLVYEEWVNVRMNKYGDTLEEAKMNALDRWGAYSNGKYKEFLPEAQAAWERYKRERNLPKWQQSSFMNPSAQRWVDQKGEAWKQ